MARQRRVHGARRSPGRPRLTELRVPTEVAIVEAATTLFMEFGYRGVTMDMVAAYAGLTKASIYYHFQDKGSLFVATAQVVFSRAREATKALLAQREPLPLRLRRIASMVLALPQPFTNFDSMMLEATAEMSPDQSLAIRMEERSLSDLIEEAMLEAASLGEIDAPDPTLVAHAFLALLQVGQARAADGGRRFADPGRTAELLVSALWDGIAHKSPPLEAGASDPSPHGAQGT